MSKANDTKSLKTLRDCMRWGVSLFNQAELTYGHGMTSSFDEAVYLTLYAVQLPPDFPESWFDTRITDAEREQIVALLKQRAQSRRPAAQLTGEAWFAGLKFAVNEHVLVPRSPIAELIEEQFAPWVNPEHVECLLDLCTGSGCIGIASAVAFPWAQVDLVDISTEAILVADKNLNDYDLGERVGLIQSDLFNELEGRRYDVIVSNPPYVPNAVVDALPEEYQHEPRLGLAAGADGMEIVERILREVPNHLTNHGVLIVEVGLIAEEVAERWPAIPFTWIDFERGGEGVFMLTADDCKAINWS